MPGLEELQRAVATVGRSVGPSVVRIGRGPGRGAGVVVAPGTVLTNAHNLRGPQVTVTFADGREVRGAAAGVDADGDLAVVRVDTEGALAVVWGDAELELGTPVLTVTLPAGGAVRVTVGMVSAVGRGFRGPRGRVITGGLEHTAPLARGSSGSPLVDTSGRLVGLSTHRLGEGFYLARPADAALRERVEGLARGESPRSPYLGVAVLPSGAARRMRAAVGLPERDGLLVRAVDEGAPAARAGVRPGDLLVEAGGRPLARPDDLLEALGNVEVDGSLVVRLVRGVEELDVEVSFAPPAEATDGEAPETA